MYKGYQILSSTQSAYLNSIITPPRNSRQLRSTSSNPLYIPRVKTKAETRAFSVAAPTVWNSLPASVKSEGNIVSIRRRLTPISLMLLILLSLFGIGLGQRVAAVPTASATGTKTSNVGPNRSNCTRQVAHVVRYLSATDRHNAR